MKAVIFDMDGVLVETDHLFDRFVVAFIKKLSTKPSPRIDDYRGMTSQDQWKVLKEKLGLPQSVDTLVLNARKEYLTYLESIPDIEAVEGVRRLLDELAGAGIPLAVASSANPVRMKTLLKRIRIDHVFSAMVSADDVANGKPAPDCFLLAAKRLQIPASDCVVIEDARRGILAAHDAGMKCVGYKGNPDNRDDLSDSDLIIRSFNELTLSKLQAL